MVQLLLILNLLLVSLLFLVVGALFYSLKKVSEKVDELEAEYLKITSGLSEIRINVEVLNSRLEFLRNQVKILFTGLGRKEK